MESVLVERRDGVITVTMNRPEKKNAVTREMTEELISVFREVAESPEDRVLVQVHQVGSAEQAHDVNLRKQFEGNLHHASSGAGTTVVG